MSGKEDRRWSLDATNKQKRSARIGARGVPKVKTGCSICKARRRKCDETKPSCDLCTSAGRKCSYPSAQISQKILQTEKFRQNVLESTRLIRFSPHNFTLPENEIPHLEYFTLITVPEFCIYFDSPLWERVALQAAFNYSCIRRIALAIGAMSKSHYLVGNGGSAASSLEYATRQYNMAINELNARLKEGSWELAVLGSVFFVALEMFLDSNGEKTWMHIQGALGIVDHFSSGKIRGGGGGNRGGTWEVGEDEDMECLVQALNVMRMAWLDLGEFDL